MYVIIVNYQYFIFGEINEKIFICISLLLEDIYLIKMPIYQIKKLCYLDKSS